ncbi:MAG: DUF262 domain-containing HNH endonuclease family protein [Deltaproteobacteria bacterium]|jgi:uncharacterized protein with ParB-like and HNH nuclease domain|nr:DUF262 domain-containing HNH endonuclease family protein [Deltaproteobacteria bacterium]
MQVGKIDLLSFITAGNSIFTIPVYQRNYEWREKECARFFHDIETMAKTESMHFVGAIVYVSKSSNPIWKEFSIIDGQQRLCTATLLLKAIHDTTTDDNIKAQILEGCLINRWATEEKYRIKFIPVESDEPAWLNIFNDAIPDDDSSNLYKNYEFFKRLVAKSAISPQRLLESFGRLVIVYIQLDEENPQIIFESINSTGLSLTTGDLIRNFLLMNFTDSEKQNFLFKEYWSKIEKFCPQAVVSDFFRNYLTMKNGAVVNKDVVYDSFKKFTHDNFLGLEENLLRELKRFAEYYSWFMFRQSNNPTLNLLLGEFHSINSSVSFPALLWFFDKCYFEKTLPEQELFEIIRLLITYQYRRLICKSQFNFALSTSSLNHLYAALPREIGDAENVLERVTDFLTSKTGSTLFPRDNDFKTGFITFDVYNAKLAYYTLAKIEHHYNKKEHVELTDDITVEHIMPQTLNSVWKADLGRESEKIHSQWLHTIGNLTLSGYNSNLRNNGYSTKIVEYKKSNIILTRDVAKINEWNADTIRERAIRLFGSALELWPLPEKYNTDDNNRAEIDYSLIYNISDDVKVTGERPQSLIFDSHEYKVDYWIDFFISLLRCLHDYDPTTFEKFAQHESVVRRRLIVKSDTKGKGQLKKIVPGYKYEGNESAQVLMSFSQIAAGMFGAEEKVSYTLKPRRA